MYMKKNVNMYPRSFLLKFKSGQFNSLFINAIFSFILPVF